MTSLPKNVGEAVDQVIRMMDAESLKRLRGMAEADIVELHFGLGMWIRNTFGLWSGNRVLLEDCAAFGEHSFCDPDEASTVIIREVWIRLRSSFPTDGESARFSQ